MLLLAGCSDDAGQRDARASATPTPISPTPTPPSSTISPPRFEDARIVVRSGDDRAYVGYTIINIGENQYASQSDIRAVGPNGNLIDWKHQTATGGPSDIVASGRSVVEPATGPMGDADYVDASAVAVGQTVMVTFTFPSGEVEVPFKVIAAS